MQKVLAVDNDQFILDFMKDLLEDAGHLVQIAQDGISALDVLETFTPNIIFVDLIMPNIDGTRLCKIIRKMEHLNNARIIILSATANEESFVASELGVEKIIPKGPLAHMANDILKVLEPILEPSPISPSAHGTVKRNIYPRRITRELLSTKKHFELILDRMTEGILEINADRRVVYANRVACTLTGLPEENLLGLDFLSLFSLKDRLWIKNRLEDNRHEREPYAGEATFTLNDYQVTADLLKIKKDQVKHIVILYNVTERKKLEETIIKSERLAAIGQLAASVAHQINSPLQGITAILSLMKENSSEDLHIVENIHLLEGAFESIRDTVLKLLDLNRPSREKKQTVNIHNIIKDTLDLVGTYLMQAGIKTYLELHKESIYLTASPLELEHVLLNLINNAIDAITGENPKETGANAGEITIKTKREKSLLLIEISDSGPGIPKNALDRLFDAFYTRKGNLGMGIGLSFCKTIIEKHEGTIAVTNTPGSGATFRISLPLQP